MCAKRGPRDEDEGDVELFHMRRRGLKVNNV